MEAKELKRTLTIVIEGELDPSYSDWFDGFRIIPKKGKTSLDGVIVDQASFIGVILKMRDLGLNIITMNLSSEMISEYSRNEAAKKP
jgi:hypothetical protein